MNILQTRVRFGPSSTASILAVDGVFECFILEDKVRQSAISGRPVSEWKIKGVTAIGVGTYAVKITVSARFKRRMIQLMDVLGFGGIRCHGGITASDTEGCLLAGQSVIPELGHDGADKAPGLDTTIAMGTSRPAADALFRKIDEALERGEEVWWQVCGLPS